uniref:Mannosyltransferase n=1 Tax=Salix viminalis TaxID=40686 RepID=A0A6N2MG91_SALVM
MGGLNEKVGFFKSGNTTLPVSSSTSIFQVSRNLTLPVSSSTSMIPLLSLHTPRPSLFLTHFPPHLSTPLPRFKSPPPQTHHPCFPISTLSAKTKTPVLRFNEFFLAIWVEQYDHLEFPGVVPRTFIGTLIVSVLASPIVGAINLLRLSKIYALIAGVRLALGCVVLSTLRFFRVQVRHKFGHQVEAFFVILTALQFHLLFYCTRPLPNILALALTWHMHIGKKRRFFPPADRQTQEMHFQTMMQDIAASLLMEFEKYVFQAEYSGTILKTPLDSQASLSSEEMEAKQSKEAVLLVITYVWALSPECSQMLQAESLKKVLLVIAFLNL